MRELICINCPLGCHLTVEGSDIKSFKVTGNKCVRGANYALTEITAPKRMVTSSVPVVGGNVARVSVKTAQAIPKEKIFECLDAIKGVKAVAPVHIGDVLIANVCDSGVDVIATRESYKI